MHLIDLLKFLYLTNNIKTLVYFQIILFVCIGFGITEPPPSYLPPRLSSSYGAPDINLLAGSGQGYHAIGSGYQESEGANLDPQLLQKIKEILLDQENLVTSHGHGHGTLALYLVTFWIIYFNNIYSFDIGIASTLSPVYGPPIPLYGVPSSRVVG